MTADGPVADGFDALTAGRWADARAAFETATARGETAEACFGLAMALWWLGENRASVERCSRAYTLFRAGGDAPSAAQCAVWLAITYKANFANFAAASGWIGRAERLLAPFEPGPLHGWTAVARAYRMSDLACAEVLTERALELARAAADGDLELVALSQLGLVRVARGDEDAGLALIDEAMAAALAGERSTLETVVYTCCDMLNACELVSDLERAAQWCQVADDFVARYGCPFLYAECRIYYGSVLSAKGRWQEAERELAMGARITEGACPGLHGKALLRLASLCIRQGRVEQAAQLLEGRGEGIEMETEATLLTAALCLARGEAADASRLLEQGLRRLEDHRAHLVRGLDLLVDAYLATGRLADADAAAGRLDVTAAGESRLVQAVAAGAQGRVLLAAGDPHAVPALEAALATWSSLALPFEVARTRVDLARALAGEEPDIAIDHARRALAAFEQLGAARDADRVAAWLRSLGIAARAAPREGGVLSKREREVLELVGLGLSNPEIATRLHISRKTASHHVSSILSKLGLRNRAEAAARVSAVLGPHDDAGRQQR